MTIDLLNDMSILTSIERKDFEKLNKRYLSCISSAVAEAAANEESTVEIDIGLGTFIIKCDDPKDVKYKFIPSEKFSTVMSDAIKHQSNDLIASANESLKKKFMNIYKDLME